jgi:hypothetical protein
VAGQTIVREKPSPEPGVQEKLEALELEVDMGGVETAYQDSDA